jgi:hypothetical protein
VRRAGWEVRLAEEIVAAVAQPFAWGRHDCYSWVRRVVHAISAHRLPGAGSYSSAQGAALRMRRRGFASLEAVMDGTLERRPGVLLAQRGDVVMAEGALGICVGARCAFISEAGMAWRPLRGCTVAWAV